MMRTFGMRRAAVLVMVLATGAALPAVAQQTKAKGKGKAAPSSTAAAPAKAPARPANAAYAQIEDVPGLPRVLIIGDSISIGYTLPVRKLLEGKANVHRPPTNCGPSTKGLVEMDAWLGNNRWDVIHFNFGLHDLKYVDEKGANTSPEKGHQQVDLVQYEKNLDILVRRMKHTGAKLIFALTTPVPAGEPQRAEGSAVAYNEAAIRVMKRHGVAIDDLHSFATARLSEIQRPANVHFTEDGSTVLAEEVVRHINQALKK